MKTKKTTKITKKTIKIAIPKGRLLESTKKLLEKSGILLTGSERNYKPDSNWSEFEFRIIKPRNIPKMVEEGMVDLGIIGQDLVEDERATVEYMLDLKTMPVYLVVAGKRGIPKKTHITVASEYTNIAERFFENTCKRYRILKTYGSTECFVPEFADLIVDHVQSGSSLRQNNLKVIDVIMKSTTRLIAASTKDKNKRALMEKFRGILEDGVKRLNPEYPHFLSKEQLKTNSFLGVEA